jgi:hypothetical protein
MIFMPTIKCATSGETINAADISLPLRNKRDRHVPKIVIGCWLAFCTLHFPSLYPRTMPYFLMTSKLFGMRRDTGVIKFPDGRFVRNV